MSTAPRPRSHVDDIADRVEAGERLSAEDALRLLRHPDLTELAWLANTAARAHLAALDGSLDRNVSIPLEQV